MKKIILLGASGSIGTQSIDVVLQHPQEFQIVAISCGKNIVKLKEILQILKINHVCVQRKSDCLELQCLYPTIRFYYGEQGLLDILDVEADIVINALVGFAGLAPTLKTIALNKKLALANKESLVVGGELVKAALKKHNAIIYPIDSEHSALFQALQGNRKEDIHKLIVSASGGSFRDYTREQLHGVSVQEALNHPNWSMGNRITIDSATMMNKGFEVIEAHYLFDIPYSQIDVVMHKESIVHSLIHYVDHSFMAQLGSADMRIAIQYALTYPTRMPLQSEDVLDLTKVASLHFQEVSFERFPLLQLAYEVGEKKGNSGAVLNAADEVCVQLFLKEKITFLQIEEIIRKCVDDITFIQNPSYEDLYESDRKTRDYVYMLIGEER